MSAELLGTFENAVHKHRIIIPAELRKRFSAAAKSRVIATAGYKNTIVIYPMDNWIELRDKLRGGSPKEKSLLTRMRRFATAEQKLEGPGRIKLSEMLLNYAEIKDKVVIVGDGAFITVCSPKVYMEQCNALLNCDDFSAEDFQI